VLAVGNQALVNGTGQQGDAVPADLEAEVLAGDAGRTSTGWFEDIPLQVIPLFWVGQASGKGHRRTASAPVLVAATGGVKWRRTGLSQEICIPCEWRRGDRIRRLLLLGVLTLLPTAYLLNSTLLLLQRPQSLRPLL
jgi:hypothetical protein